MQHIKRLQRWSKNRFNVLPAPVKAALRIGLVVLVALALVVVSAAVMPWLAIQLHLEAPVGCGPSPCHP